MHLLYRAACLVTGHAWAVVTGRPQDAFRHPEIERTHMPTRKVACARCGCEDWVWAYWSACDLAVVHGVESGTAGMDSSRIEYMMRYEEMRR